MTHLKQQPPGDCDPRWWLAIAGCNDGVWDWNIKTDEVFFSDRLKSMLGYLPEEIGSSADEWRGRVHPDDLAWVTQEVCRHLEGKTRQYQAEYRLRHKSGRYLWVLGRGGAQFDAAGQALRMTGSHVDVTERHLAEEAVQNLSEELQTILNLSPDGFVAFDRQGKVKYATPAFMTMTGLDTGQIHDLAEDPFWALLVSLSNPQSRVGNVSTVRHNLAQSNNLRRSLLELVQPAGRVLLVTRQSSAASSIANILCFRDVSFETEVDQLKSEFMSTAAHELRTPLASIYGFAEILLSDDTDAATRREFTEIIYQQSQAMTNLLNEMLDLARIEARRQTDFVFTRVGARALVQSVLDGFKWPADREAVRLALVQDDLWVNVDIKKASQVILNVLSNAYKYSPNGGSMSICVQRAPQANCSAEVAISICDQGMGMTPAEQARVFERFYRAHPSSRIPGTGLGLSIVKEIMALLDGRVAIDSQPGSGTCVTLFFPLA